MIVRGLRYHVRLSGPEDAPPVFLLHGLLDTGASFGPLSEGLNHERRLITPDWRGHGDTDPAPQGYWFPDYLADLEALIAHYAGDRPVTLIGHSMGGQVASLYAGLRPDRVRRLVCLDSLNVPATPPEDIPRRYRGWLDAQTDPPAPRRYPDLAALAERIATRYPELDAGQVDSLAQAWSRPDESGGIRLATDPGHRVPFPFGFRPEEAMAVWRQVTAPVLCLDGENSPAKRWVDDEEMARRRACFADVTHVVLPGCGHMLHLEKPAAAAECIAGFLDRHRNV